jgi:hypothetical protein
VLIHCLAITAAFLGWINPTRDFAQQFDRVASAIQIWTEAECLFSVPSRRDVHPSAMPADKCSDPVGTIPTVSQQRCSRLKARQELGGEPIIVGLAGCERDADWRALAIDNRVNLARQPASYRPMDCLLASEIGAPCWCTRTMNVSII